MNIGMYRYKSVRALLIITALLLTSDRVNSAFCHECAPFSSNAVAYWPMTSGSKGSDLSGNENHATFVGLTYTDGPTGEDNGAVHFNGSSNSYATVTNSPSIQVGKYPGFTFSGYIRFLGFQNKTALLIDWSDIETYGMFIVVAYEQVIQLHLYPNQYVYHHKAEFPKHKLIKCAWHFIGLSYDKATGRATMFIDGMSDVNQIDKHIVAGTGKTKEVGLGRDLSDFHGELNFHGDMSCIMLFKFALTADDFQRVWRFCSGVTSAETKPPSFPTRADIGWIVAGICLVLMVVLIALIVGVFRRIGVLSTVNGSEDDEYDRVGNLENEPEKPIKIKVTTPYHVYESLNIE